ncbi:MAG: small ribosomal subunit Rsm22 family protein [Planctomycetota bacterium]
MSNYFGREDLARLKHLRGILLSIEERVPGTPAPRYWDFERDLELYDSTFAQRIGWKWRAALSELAERGFVAPGGKVLDYGCGTGIAAREWLAGGLGASKHVQLWDREGLARSFAAKQVRAEHPGAKVTSLQRPPSPNDLEGNEVLLVSHVLDELGEGHVMELLTVARRAGAVIWVEPGSRITSRRLSEVRDALLDEFDVVAPCTHSAQCGALRGDAERTWCHFFGEPAQEAFIDGRWAEFGRELGIDMRSLPYSYIALTRRVGATPAPDLGGARLLGRPRVQRGRALIDTCEAVGVREEMLLQRLDKALFKALERNELRRVIFERVDEKIVGITRP